MSRIIENCADSLFINPGSLEDAKSLVDIYNLANNREIQDHVRQKAAKFISRNLDEEGAYESIRILFQFVAPAIKDTLRWSISKWRMSEMKQGSNINHHATILNTTMKTVANPNYTAKTLIGFFPFDPQYAELPEIKELTDLVYKSISSKQTTNEINLLCLLAIQNLSVMHNVKFYQNKLGFIITTLSREELISTTNSISNCISLENYKSFSPLLSHIKKQKNSFLAKQEITAIVGKLLIYQIIKSNKPQSILSKLKGQLAADNSGTIRKSIRDGLADTVNEKTPYFEEITTIISSD